MAYVDPDYSSKKRSRWRRMLAEIHYTYNPSGLYAYRINGRGTVEGPHFPKLHRWYASVVVAIIWHVWKRLYPRTWKTHHRRQWHVIGEY